MRSAPKSVLPPSLHLRLTALTAVAAVLLACGGGEPVPPAGSGGAPPAGTGGGSGTFCDAAPVFVSKCDGQFCHGGNGTLPPTGGVELVTPPAGMTLGQSLFNKPAVYPDQNGALACPTATPELIINGTTPASSLLLNKVTGTPGTNFACGEAMPPAIAPLTTDELTCLTEWVNGVAQTGGI